MNNNDNMRHRSLSDLPLQTVYEAPVGSGSLEPNRMVRSRKNTLNPGFNTKTSTPSLKGASTSRYPSSLSNVAFGNVKNVGLGIGRRPSDNLMQSYNYESSATSHDNLHQATPETMSSNSIHFTPPNTSVMLRKDRPISNESIITRTSDLFSSPTLDYNSNESSTTGSLFGDNNLADETFEHNEGVSIISDMETSFISQTQQLTNLQITESSSPDTTATLLKVSPSHKRTGTQGLNHSGSTLPTISSTHVHDNDVPRDNRSLSSIGSQIESYKSRSNTHSQSYFSGIDSNNKNPFSNKQINKTADYLPHTKISDQSQRYKTIKQNQKNLLRQSIKQKERYYDESEQKGLYYGESDLNDALIWNVPMASNSTSSFLISNFETHRKNIDQHGNTDCRGSEDRKIYEHSNSSSTVDNLATSDLNGKLKSKASSTTTLRKSGKQIVGPGTFRRTTSQSISHTNSNDEFGPSIQCVDMGIGLCEMPTSPIPGVNNISDSQYLRDTSKHLSTMYVNSSNRLSRSKLLERTRSAGTLPLHWKEAQEEGLEDLVLLSDNKLGLISSSRPSWLPPKDPNEKKMHEKEIERNMTLAALQQLDRSKVLDDRLLNDKTNIQIYQESLREQKTPFSVIQRAIWDTPFQGGTLRLDMYQHLLKQDWVLKDGIFESYNDVLKKSNDVDYPRSKLVELQKTIDLNIKSKSSNNKKLNESYDDLICMLKLKSLSLGGQSPGDELLFYHLLCEYPGELSKVWNVVHLIQLACFDDKCKESFDAKIVSRHGLVGQYLTRPEFAHELNSRNLNTTNMWSFFQRFPHDLFLWVLDIIVVLNAAKRRRRSLPTDGALWWERYSDKQTSSNYKILIALTLNVLVNYHFGFDDFLHLNELQDPTFSIPAKEEPTGHETTFERTRSATTCADTTILESRFIANWRKMYKKC